MTLDRKGAESACSLNGKKLVDFDFVLKLLVESSAEHSGLFVLTLLMLRRNGAGSGHCTCLDGKVDPKVCVV